MENETRVTRQRMLTRCRSVFFSALLMLPVLWPPGSSADVQLPVGMVDTQARFPVKSDGYFNFDAYLTVFTHEASETAGYFWSQEFKFKNGDGGYFGLQTNGFDKDGRKLRRMAIFSIFDNRADVARGVETSDHRCKRFDTNGGDGSFVKCTIPYDWVMGRAYRLRVWALGDRPGNRSSWGAWVKDMDTGRETFIGAVDVPRSWNWLDSYANAFTEYFGPAVGSCADIPYTFAGWGQPTANNGVVGARIAVHPDYPAGYGNCLDFARAFNFGNAVYSETGFGNSRADAIDLTIHHYYRSGLARNPDAGGFAFWQGIVGNKRAGACTAALTTVAHGIMASQEFMARWGGASERVDRLYLTILHRRPDSGGRDFWIRRFKALGNWGRRVTEFVSNPEIQGRLQAICTHRF